MREKNQQFNKRKDWHLYLFLYFMALGSLNPFVFLISIWLFYPLSSFLLFCFAQAYIFPIFAIVSDFFTIFKIVSNVYLLLSCNLIIEC